MLTSGLLGGGVIAGEQFASAIVLDGFGAFSRREVACGDLVPAKPSSKHQRWRGFQRGFCLEAAPILVLCSFTSINPVVHAKVTLL